ncbi:hypothetical protein B0H16DRAFT_1626511 [Mycena metata]|uniref:FAD/NAD(P)-binding domain-containing protein n=1 Tax=Mycena metata TaxID=1033252 RepID=A0AAD7H508_9AGAR|nr:hypothetical protein B0H16DRAFT_1626511 [Mycena metata]
MAASILPGRLLILPAAYIFLLISWRALRHYLLVKTNGCSNLPLLQNGRNPKEKIRGTAVVCGGSVAGLLTARVCHNHFERVLIIEPEAWVASEEGRKIKGWDQKLQRSRVAQYNSLHACQCFLFAGLKTLFPDLEEQCRASDIKIVPSNPRFNLSGVLLRIPFSAYKSGLPKTMYLGRSGFETLLRRLVLDRASFPNIEFMTGTVTDVLPDPANRSRLNKVVVRTESGVDELEVTLVADCTGPTRAGMKWLERSGYGYSPAYSGGKLPLDQLKISFDQKLRYSSIMFRITPEFHDRLPFPADMKNTGSIYTFLDEEVEKGRTLFALTRPDGNQLLAFTGHHGTVQSPPQNLTELKEYVRALRAVEPIPDWVFEILDMLQEVENTAVVAIVKIPPTSYVQYHRGTNLPSNWVALGDSTMTLNPLFSEGCTKAFKGALALHNVLCDTLATPGNTLPSTFSTKFFAEHFDKTDLAWQNTKLMDYGVPMTVPLPGESLSSGEYLRWYITKLQHLAINDDHAALVLYNSAMGLASPVDAFHPNLVLKVFWRALWGGI